MSNETYLARQPIVDAQHQLFAYELLFRPSLAAVSADIHNPLQAGVDVINNTLCIGTDWLLQGKLAFFNMDEATLMSDFITLLPPQRVVLEILETVRMSPTLAARVHELRQRGYHFALDDFIDLPQYQPLLPHVDFIKLDVQQQSRQETLRLVSQIRRVFVGKLVAEKVETREMFDLCAGAGMEYFQGYYFAHPENIASKTLTPSQLTVLGLMNKVRTCEDLGEIEECLRHDAALTFRLMRLVNSVAFGLTHQVQSVRHALSVVGLQALYRWLTLLLATSGDSDTLTITARTAVVRGRMCELLWAGRMDRIGQDELFITGVFSLLEALMEMPLSAILERTPLPQRLIDALLRRAGPYGPYLALAEASETGDFARIGACSQALALSTETVNSAQLQAMAWAEGLDLDA